MTTVELVLAIIGLRPEGGEFSDGIKLNRLLLSRGEGLACNNELLELALFVF